MRQLSMNDTFPRIPLRENPCCAFPEVEYRMNIGLRIYYLLTHGTKDGQISGTKLNKSE